MKIYEYKNYDEYVFYQTEANKHKINNVYVHKETIRRIANDKKIADNILCHGTRNGAEQKYFKHFFPNAFIIGTEISETASQFEMTIQHDFTLPNPEWIDKFDIVYSNSFDHSINPVETLTTWKNQLNSQGKLYLEHTEDPKLNVSKAWDPLAISRKEIEKIMNQIELKLVKILKSKSHNGNIYVCQK